MIIAALCALLVRFTPEVEAQEADAYRAAEDNLGGSALSLR